MLFALPFAVVGVGATYWTMHTAIQHSAMQAWVEVPAIIKHAELKRHRGKDNDTFQTIADYEYEFGGRKYTGQRVSLHGGSDNIGSFQQDVYNELKRHVDDKRPFRCYVNPSNPNEPVLYRHLRWEMLAFQTMFATLFGSFGFGLLFGSIIAAYRSPRALTGDAPADQPWAARADWASGEIRASGGAAVTVPVLTVLALYWNVASWPLLSKLPAILPPANGHVAWLALFFPVMGLLLVCALFHQYFRRRKFGESTLQLATTPGVVGGQLAGVVKVANYVPPESGIHLKLSCIERTRSDKNTRENVLWQEERLVTEPMHDRFTGSMAIPVLFAIPYEAQETSPTDSNRTIEWRLDVSAMMSGVDYKSQFEVPVFKTAESRKNFQLDKDLVAEFAAAPPRELVLSQAGIVKEPLPAGGVRLVFPAARNLGSALGITAVLVVWSAIIWIMIHFQAPVFITVFFGLFELLILWVAVNLWFYRSAVEAHADRLSFRGGLLGIGRQHAWAADEVQEFTTSDWMSSGTHVWKNIVVVLRNGKKWTIAQFIYGKLAQQAVIDELIAALRRDQDENQVAF